MKKIKELNAIGVTNRGFTILDEFTDDHNTEITIQESSSVIPSLWLFTKNPSDGKMDLVGHEGKPFKMDMHLGVKEAKRVVKALQRFIDVNED